MTSCPWSPVQEMNTASALGAAIERPATTIASGGTLAISGSVRRWKLPNSTISSPEAVRNA